MFIRSWGAILHIKNLFSDAHLIGQLTNWIIDQIFEIELASVNGFDRHEMWRNEVFTSNFAKVG